MQLNRYIEERKATINYKELINNMSFKKADELKLVLNCHEDILKEFNEKLFLNLINRIRAIIIVEVESMFKSGARVTNIL